MLTEAQMFQWIAYLQLPHNFAMPAAPCPRGAFLNAARASKQVPMWRHTLVVRLGYTAAQANAVATRSAAFNLLVQGAPQGFH